MAWRTDITVLLFVVIALTKGNLNVIGEWNLYGSLTPNHNTAQPQGRYFINHVKAAAPPTVPPRRDRTNARLSGASVLQFSASKTNNQAASSFSAASPQMGPIQSQTGPTHSQIGPTHSQMVPSHSQMGPSHTPMGPTQAQINSLNAIKSAFGSQKMVLIDKDMGQVQIQPGSFTDRVVIRDPSRAISYSQPYSVSHRKLTPWQQPPSTLPPPMPAKTLPKVTIITPPPVKPRFQFTIADGLKVKRGNLQYVSSRPSQNPEKQGIDQHVVKTHHTSSREFSPEEIRFHDNNHPIPVYKQYKQHTNTPEHSSADISNLQNRKTLVHVVDLTQPYNFTNSVSNLASSNNDSQILLSRDISNFKVRAKRQAVNRSPTTPNRTRDVHTVLMGNASLVDSFARRNKDRTRNRIKEMREERNRKRLKKRPTTKLKAFPSRNRNENNVKKKSKQSKNNHPSIQENNFRNEPVSGLGRRRMKSESKKIDSSLPKIENRHRYSPSMRNRPTKIGSDLNSKSKVNSHHMRNRGSTPKTSLKTRLDDKLEESFSPRVDRQRMDALPYHVERNTKLGEGVAQSKAHVPQRRRNIYLVISSGRKDHSRGKGRGIRYYSMNDRARHRYIENLITKGHEMMEKLYNPTRLRHRDRVKPRRRGIQRNRNVLPLGRRGNFKRNDINPRTVKEDLPHKFENEFNDNKIDNFDKRKSTDSNRKSNFKGNNHNKTRNQFVNNENLNSPNDNIYFVNASENIDKDLKNILTNPLKVKTGNKHMASNRSKMLRNGNNSNPRNYMNLVQNKDQNKNQNNRLSSSKSFRDSVVRKKQRRRNTNEQVWSQRKPAVPSLFRNEHPLTRPFNAFPGRPKRHRDRKKNLNRELKVRNRNKGKRRLNVKNHMQNKMNRRHNDNVRKRNRKTLPTQRNTLKSPRLPNDQVKTKPFLDVNNRDILDQIRQFSNTQPMAPNTGQEQSQKPFDGSKGSNIRHQDDFVKYKFLETVKNGPNKKVRTSLGKKSEDTTVPNIDYNRVDGFSNYTLQNSTENGDLSERKQNLKKQKLETETEENTLEPKEKSEQPLANNRTEGSESMTKTNESFSSSKRDSDLENLDKKSNSEIGKLDKKGGNSHKNSKSQKKKKKRRRNFNRKNQNKKRDKSRSKTKKKKKERSKSKSKTRKPRSTSRINFNSANPSKISLLVYLKRLSKIRDRPLQTNEHIIMPNKMKNRILQTESSFSTSPSTIITSSQVNITSTEGNTSKANNSLTQDSIGLKTIAPSAQSRPSLHAHVPILNNRNVTQNAAYSYEPNTPNKEYAIVNLKSYLDSGSKKITKKTKRHSNAQYSSYFENSKQSSGIANKNQNVYQTTVPKSPQGGGLTQLPVLTFTTVNGTLTNVSGVPGLNQRKFGINVTLTRLAELKTNLLTQILPSGNAQGAGGRGAHPPAANHGPPPGPIYPVNRGQAAPPQPRYNPPPPQWNQPPPQNQWNRPPPQQFYQNHPPTHPPRYLPPPTHPPRHYYPPPRRARPTPAPYVPPKTTRPTTTTTTTTKKPEIEYDIEGPPRTTQAPPPTRTRPTARPKCDYWSMDPFGNLQFYPCQRPVFRPPTTTPAPAPMFYFYDVPTPDPWKWYDYPNEVKIEVKVERDKRTK